MYLGHHHGVRRETGEPQLVFNYFRGFTDFIVRFTFGNGVHFRSPKATEAIVPDLLKMVWEVHNDKEKVLLEIGQTGSISGDSFTKVAWEPEYVDSAGNYHEGRVRILPLNPSFCMPVDDTEVLTRRGWLSADDLTTDDQVLSLEPDSDELVWADVEAINIYDWDGPMHSWESERFSALSTPDHRWVFQTKRGRRVIRTSEEISRTTNSGALVLAGGTPTHFSTEAKYTDEFVELVGWVVTEGNLRRVDRGHGEGFSLSQNERVYPDFVARIRRLAKHYRDLGMVFTENGTRDDGLVQWYGGVDLGREIRTVLGDSKSLLPEFLTSLTFGQANLLYNTLMDGDGDARRSHGEFFYQNNWEAMDSFQMLAMMLGKRSTARIRKKDSTAPNGMAYTAQNDGLVSVYQNRTHNQQNLHQRVEHYTGRVWCPTTSTGTWVARRKEVMQDGSGKKVIYLTGNCFP